MMGTAIVPPNVETAPRDKQALVKLGIFNIRHLLTELGALATNEQKLAFSKMGPEEKVNTLYTLLLEYDKMKGNGVARVPAPAVPMTQMLPPVTPVDPATVAQAQVAARPKREPKTSVSSLEGQSGDLATITNLLNAVKEQQDDLKATLETSLKTLGDRVEMDEVKKKLDNLMASYGAIRTAMVNLGAAVEAATKNTQLSISLSLLLAEQVLQATREDVLRMAADDMPAVAAIFTPTGKE